MICFAFCTKLFFQIKSVKHLNGSILQAPKFIVLTYLPRDLRVQTNMLLICRLSDYWIIQYSGENTFWKLHKFTSECSKSQFDISIIIISRLFDQFAVKKSTQLKNGYCFRWYLCLKNFLAALKNSREQSLWINESHHLFLPKRNDLRQIR